MTGRPGYRFAALSSGIGLALCGVVGIVAWWHGMWGLLTGAVLVTAWLTALLWWIAGHVRPVAATARHDRAAEDAMVLRVLLDSAPTPLLAVDAGAVRALNRAARAMFATDDRVLPPPPAVIAAGSTHLRHEGRGWRIDRVEVAGTGRVVVALIDIEREERTAEARATADLIEVLGHELLNGLAPIVSLAESGLAAAALPGGGATLLPEILGTLARRAEGLQRFTEAYRALARLPEPMPRAVSITELVGDLARLFAGRWPGVTLDVAAAPVSAVIDGDQASQAIWAVLQNAAEAASTGGDGRVTLVARHDASELVVEVADSGPGIASDAADRIFRPFHTTKAGGTGIGLSLARQIALAHGGTLTLLPGLPTTFRFTLPG